VRAGHAVRLTVEGDATVYHGRVVRLSPIVQEQNRTLLIEAEVPNQNAVLKPGAFARGEIVTEGSQPVIRIPAASLVTFAGVEKVLVVRQARSSRCACRRPARQRQHRDRDRAEAGRERRAAAG